MTEQQNLFEQEPYIPKRLVAKDYMHNLEWGVYEELKQHLTKEHSIKADSLAELFEINTRTLRDVIDNIRSKQQAKIIGDSNGYYIGTRAEFDKWFSGRMKRTLSSIETTLNMNPEADKIIYWFLNKYCKTAVQQGQSQLQFNGWEREFIRQFAEDYKKEME